MIKGLYKHYPENKDSGLGWCGDLPGDWEFRRTKFLFQIKKRIAGELGHSVLSITQKGIKVKDTESGEGQLSMDYSKYQLVKVGEFAMNHMDLLTGYIDISKYDGVTSPDYRVFCSRDYSIIDRYFLYLYQLAYIKGIFFPLGQGSAHLGRWRLPTEEFNDFRWPVPSKQEQKTIANFLDHETAKIDTLIDKQQQLIKLLKEKRQAVISHAVTKGLNPATTMKDSGVEWLGEVPEHWEVTKFGRLAFMQEGPGLRTWQFTEDGTRVICVTNITEDGIDFSRLSKYISENEYCSNYRHFTVAKRDVLLSSSGNSWGKVAVYEGDEKVILNTSTIRLNELPSLPLNKEFIEVFLRSEVCREQLGLAMTGACQPNFGPTHLNEIMCPVPPSDEQVEIVDEIIRRIAPCERATAISINMINLLQERRTALIFAAVTGKIDVRNWQPEQSAIPMEASA